MGLSVSALSAIIFFVIVIHVCVLGAIYYYKEIYLRLKNKSNEDEETEESTKKCTVGDNVQNLLRWILTGMIPLSWILSLVVVDSCKFLMYEYEEFEFGFGFKQFYLDKDLALLNGQKAGCGSFKLDDGLGFSHRSTSVAYSFMVWNILLTTTSIIFVVLLQCFLKKGRESIWLALKIAMYLSLWCALFTFYLQESSICDIYNCSLGRGGATQVFNVLVLIAISVVLFLISSGNEPAFDAKTSAMGFMAKRTAAKASTDVESNN